MASWTLTYDGVTKSFADWGLKDLKRTQLSQAVGGVSFVQSGAAFDGTPLFAIDSVVTISKDGAAWHVGPVIMTPSAASTKSERLEYQIADPWWYLEQLPFEQTIITGSGAVATQTTRIALFANVTGGVTVKSTVQEMIALAMYLAVEAGASMQVAFSGNFGISPPISDMRDPTCAEVIRQVLRWVPDATCGWDYSTTPPTLRVATRAAATARTIDLADYTSVNLIDITPRDDLRRDRVVIFYEITTTDDTDTYVTYAEDSAGSGSPFRTLKATIPLSGPQTQRQKQYLETETVEEDNASWWKKHVATLNDVSDLEITDGTIEPEEEDGDSFDAEIIEGQVPGWLDDPENPASGMMRVTAKASYTVTTDDGGEIVFKDDPVSVSVNCTYLGTGTYSHVTSYTFGESVPIGVAASLLAALGVLQYDCRTKVKQRECSFITRPGEVLNLLNGKTAWATARLQVQKVDEVIDAGETVITCGPPKHLSPQDIIEMLRTLRGKPPVYTLNERASGIKGDGTDNKGGRGGGNKNGNPAAANWTRVVSIDSASGSTMTLDAADGVKLEKEDGTFIDHQTANGRSLYQDPEGNSCEVKPTGVDVLDNEGNGIVVTSSGLVITNGDTSATLTAAQLLILAGSLSSSLTDEQLVFSNDGQTSILEAGMLTLEDGAASIEIEPAHLLLDGGSGSTNSITDEQMVISGSGATGIYAADSLSLSTGGNSADLDTNSLTIVEGSNRAAITAEGGFSNTSSGGLAQLNGVSGVNLDISGGTVEIMPVSGQDISLQDSDLCINDPEAGPTAAHGYVLRGEAEPV